MTPGYSDYHIHSLFSADAEPADILKICERAVEIGLVEIAFTDHIDFDPTDLCYKRYDVKTAKNAIKQARDLLGDKLVIRRGVEVDYQVRFHNQVSDFLSKHDFDYVIGSAHYLDGLILVDPRCFQNKSEADVYEPYFDLVEMLVETRLFDSAAHLEFCKRLGAEYYGPFNFERYKKRIESVLRLIVSNNMALEINTSGLRHTPKEIYPCPPAVRLFKEIGGEKVVIGSDSHKLEFLGFGIQEGYRIAREAGFNETTTFEARRCQMRPMP